MDCTLTCSACGYTDKFAVLSIAPFITDLIWKRLIRERSILLFRWPKLIAPVCPECDSKRFSLPFFFRRSRKFNSLPPEKQAEINDYIAEDTGVFITSIVIFGALLLTLALLTAVIYLFIRPTNWNLYE